MSSHFAQYTFLFWFSSKRFQTNHKCFRENCVICVTCTLTSMIQQKQSRMTEHSAQPKTRTRLEPSNSWHGHPEIKREQSEPKLHLHSLWTPKKYVFIWFLVEDFLNVSAGLCSFSVICVTVSQKWYNIRDCFHYPSKVMGPSLETKSWVGKEEACVWNWRKERM